MNYLRTFDERIIVSKTIERAFVGYTWQYVLDTGHLIPMHEVARCAATVKPMIDFYEIHCEDGTTIRTLHMTADEIKKQVKSGSSVYGFIYEKNSVYVQFIRAAKADKKGVMRLLLNKEVVDSEHVKELLKL